MFRPATNRITHRDDVRRDDVTVTVRRPSSATVRRVTDRTAASCGLTDPDLRRLRDRLVLAVVPLVLDVAYLVIRVRRYRRARAARRTGAGRS